MISFPDVSYFLSTVGNITNCKGKIKGMGATRTIEKISTEKTRKDPRNRFLVTIPEAMDLVHESVRQKFVEDYIYSGKLGVFEQKGERPLIPIWDIEKLIRSNTVYYTQVEDKRSLEQSITKKG